MVIDITAPSADHSLLDWVGDAVSLCDPDEVHWCDGSAEEYEHLCTRLIVAGTFERLAEDLRPSSYLARSHPGDVARVEDRTFICSESERDTGPTNHWRDPQEMRALLPFCGYDIGDYFAHWLRLADRDGATLPRIFSVNWFRKSDDGRWLWPGFGENARVLEWIHRRCDGAAGAVDTPIGLLPAPGALDLNGLSVDLDALLDVDTDGWLEEVGPIRDFYASLGDSLPAELQRQLDGLERRLREGSR